MKLSCVLLLVSTLHTALSFPPAPTGDPVLATRGLVTRILGKEWVDRFSYEVIPQDNGADVFELSYDAQAKRPVFRGNNAVAMSTCFNYYLKYYCNCSISWGRDGTGDQLHMPSTLPTPKTERVVFPNKYRYYQNVCTVSYSMAWWDLDRWVREIDWMAMNGLNFILSFTGQEYVWKKFYLKLGLTKDELDKYFSGPAFLAWQRMGNIHGWGGPLDDDWINSQAELQKNIFKQLELFGMINILPGFAGHVPEGLKRVYPNASYTRSQEWGRFGSQYSEDYLLEPTDPLFVKLGKEYYDTLKEEFGTNHFYNADTYNEMAPSSTDLTFLKESNEAIYNAMKASDADAVFVMQGWLFRSDGGFWHNDRIQAYLSGVPNGNMIILDLSSEQDPIWSKTESYYGKPFIWCMLHNYGGTRGIYGDLATIGNDPVDARMAKGSTMVGVGMTPEAIEHNPVMYDLMGEMSWRSDKVQGTMPWVEAYAQRRYKAMTQNIRNAWILLLNGAYQFHWSWDIKSLVVRHPEFNMAFDSRFAPYKIATAWRYLVTDVMDGKVDGTIGPLLYDIVDFGRQMIVNLFVDVYKMYTGGYNSHKPEVYPAIHQLSIAWMAMFEDLDSLLKSNVNFLLGTWIEDARKSCTKCSEETIKLTEFNARNQITMWGPNMNIEDYAAKEWSGLVTSYHQQRWKLFINKIEESIASKTAFNKTEYEDELFKFETQWGNQQNSFPSNPTDNTMEVAKRLLARYFRNEDYISKHYTMKIDSDIVANDMYGGPIDLWTNATETYVVLCEMNPSCVGFSFSSTLKQVSFKSTTTGVEPARGRVIYLRGE